MTTATLELPPALSLRLTADAPFDAARAAARDGETAGAVFWRPLEAAATTAEAGLVLAPEEPLRTALSVVLALEQALTDAIGAIGPPETAAMWSWPDTPLLNGGAVGRLRVAASSVDENHTPDWLVVGLRLRLRLAEGSTLNPETRRAETSLQDEDLGDLAPEAVFSAWARHAVRWIYTRDVDGLRPLAEAWTARAAHRGETVLAEIDGETVKGAFLGLDEHGGLLVQSTSGMRAAPLTLMLRRGWTDDRVLRAADPAR